VNASQLEAFPLLHELSEGERDELAEPLEQWSFKQGEAILVDLAGLLCGDLDQFATLDATADITCGSSSGA